MLIRKQISITKEEDDFYKNFAEKKNISFADVVRRLLDEFMVKCKQNENDSILIQIEDK